ncbi:sensor histidine kinase [Cupriavidus sp. IDO]|uniref:sensor histidine kinase n=1 Tax=Cupriavidus sp. IDO TaxID=1539142 RepID=UPI00187D0712
MTDFGTGIPSHVLPKLFQPFQRSQAPSPHAGSGIGLGLAFVRTVVLRHGGTVSVTSTPMKGTTFVVPAAGSAGILASME